MESEKEKSFEEAIEKLEEISARLANEKIPLDEAIELYEQGVAYYDICKRKLENANRRITIIEESLNKEND